jgi:hypothetical protein
MRRELETGLTGDVPIVLSQWYDTAKWMLEKIDKFPKNQRFILGTRLADRTLDILEGLIQASYTGGREKLALLETANRDLAVLRWLVRMAKARQVITVKQYEYGCGRMYESGKMLGGWIKDVRKRTGR